MKQKHYDMIVARAEGKQIQVLTKDNEWEDRDNPYWTDNFQYRIKQEPKPDIVEKRVLFKIDNNNELSAVSDFKLTYCGETGKLKSVEVI